MRNRVLCQLAWSVSCLIVGLIVVQPSPCFGQAFVQRVEPAAMTRGEVTRVILHGSRLDMATALWISIPGGQAKAPQVGQSSPDRAVFDVRVP